MQKFSTVPQKIRRWGLAGVIALLLVGIISVLPAAAQGDTAQLTVVAPALNVRSGPGVDNPALSVLRQGDQVATVGHDTITGWWQVQLPNDQTGWVSGDPTYVAVSHTITNTPALSTQPIHNSQLSGLLVFQTVSGGPIYAINQDGSNLRYLTTGIDPALSPDGQWVAFTRWDNPQIGALGSLWVINGDGSGERQIAGNVFQPKSPTWSPDGGQLILSMAYGEHLVAQSKCSGQRPPRGATNVVRIVEDDGDVTYCFDLSAKPYWGLRQVNVATGQFEDLNYDINSISPTWDPTNPARVVYDGGWGLVSLDLTQGKTQLLTPDVQQHSPVFSPDGSQIAVSYRQDDHWEIHVLNVDGSGDIRLTETSYLTWVEQELRGETPRSWNNAAPVWSPDSSQIAFLTDRAGQWEIWTMNVDGSNQLPLFPPEVLAGIALQYNGMDERVLSWR